jgi:hypothetical protein
MYSDEEVLETYKKVWITKEVYNLIIDKKKELEGEGRRLSMQKIVNNVLYENLRN